MGYSDWSQQSGVVEFAALEPFSLLNPVAAWLTMLEALM